MRSTISDTIVGCAIPAGKFFPYAPLSEIAWDVRRASRPTEGVFVPTVFVHHDVRDRDHWLSATTREEFFAPLGVTNIRTFVNPADPTHVGVLMDVPDMDAMGAALASPEAAEAEAKDGVVAESIVLLVEA